MNTVEKKFVYIFTQKAGKAGESRAKIVIRGDARAVKKAIKALKAGIAPTQKWGG